MKRYLLLASFLIALENLASQDTCPDFDVFEFMKDGYSTMAFLSQSQSRRFDSLDLVSLTEDFRKDSLELSKKYHLVVGNDTFSISGDHLYFTSFDSSRNIYIREVDKENLLDDEWQLMRKMIGRYTGIQNGRRGYYYLKLEPSRHCSLNATFRTHYHLVNIRVELSFRLGGISQLTTEQYEELIEERDFIDDKLAQLTKYLTTGVDRIYRPLSDHRILTAAERAFGLVQFWTEVKYNFAYFDQVPDLDWDQALIEYLPRVLADQSDLEYYKVLMEICAKLNDGHTEIFLPVSLAVSIAKPPVEIRWIADHFFVTNVDRTLTEQIPLGSQVFFVEGIPIENYIEKNIRPYVSSSTEHIRKKIICERLLEGATKSSLEIGIVTPSGQDKRVKLDRKNGSIDWLRKTESRTLIEYKYLDNDISYVSINGFESEKIVDEFRLYLDSIRVSKSLILDLRKNGGGNSSYAYEILRYLTRKPIITSKWSTREHKASFKALGSSLNHMDPSLSEWEQEYALTYAGNFWYESKPDTILPHWEEYIDIPTVILTGNGTASAAEDFLVACENVGFGVRIGEYTFGSTGQPLRLNLPGGGYARICTKKDTYPDGREFVGYGIKPDHIIKQEIDQILSGEDKTLKFAIDYLKSNSH